MYFPIAALASLTALVLSSGCKSNRPEGEPENSAPPDLQPKPIESLQPGQGESCWRRAEVTNATPELMAKLAPSNIAKIRRTDVFNGDKLISRWKVDAARGCEIQVATEQFGEKGRITQSLSLLTESPELAPQPNFFEYRVDEWSQTRANIWSFGEPDQPLEVTELTIDTPLPTPLYLLRGAALNLLIGDDYLIQNLQGPNQDVPSLSDSPRKAISRPSAQPDTKPQPSKSSDW